MAKVSVIVTVKNDKRIVNLIRALEKQTFKDFEVLIHDCSDEKLFDGKTSLNLRYFHTESMRISEGFNFLFKRVKGKLVAITESDCVPSEKWLEELVSGHKGGKTVTFGVQTNPGLLNYGNLLVPGSALKIPLDLSLKDADDTDWFYSLKERGYKFNTIDKAVVKHYKIPTRVLKRAPNYAKEHAYVYLKHGDGERVLKSIGFQAFRSFFSGVMAILLAVFGVYYKIKLSLKRKHKH